MSENHYPWAIIMVFLHQGSDGFPTLHSWSDCQEATSSTPQCWETISISRLKGISEIPGPDIEMVCQH